MRLVKIGNEYINPTQIVSISEVMRYDLEDCEQGLCTYVLLTRGDAVVTREPLKDLIVRLAFIND